uniref:Uncharacterized protein n=1 Tax=Meloidogyne enterolobii TaxID=390850 RepID=A0A6V7W7W0_MELEN|nr:unnamed protein product [Meloidogyne enterolobii]
MTKMPKIRDVIEEVFKKKIFNSQHEEGALAIGAVYLGVLFGNINYFDNKRTSKIEIIKMKISLGNAKDVANLFWEAIAIYVKEFYSTLHIDVRSSKAIQGLGRFAVRFIEKSGNRERMDAYCAFSQAYDISREGIGWYFGGEHKDLFWSKLKPYVFGEKLASENEKLDEDFRKLEFKRIPIRRQGLIKQKLKKYFLFKSY